MIDGHVRQVLVLYSNTCMGISLGQLSIGHLRRVVILEEWLSYRGGCLRRFDYTDNASRVISQYLKPLCGNGYKINDTQTFASMIKNQTPFSPLSK